MDVGSAPAEPSPAITRRSTSEALERLAQTATRETAYSRWYQPGKDFCTYSSAQDACRLSEAGLKKLKLTADDREAIKSTKSIKIVLDRMEAVLEEADKKSLQSASMKRLSRFINGFCDFAIKVSGIVRLLLPQSPEYTITYGFVMIIFQAVVDKRDKQDSLSDFLETVASKLPILDFYESVFPTTAMKVTAAALYVEIIAFLERGARYYCTGRIGKLIDAVLQPIESDFNSYISRIDVLVVKMNDLKDVALAAQQNDMKDTLEDAGRVIVRLYQKFEESVSTMGSSLIILDQKIERLRTDGEYITSFQAKSYVQTLRQAAFLDVLDADDELKMVIRRGFRLSPKDHWENNGVLDALLKWSQGGRRSLLWVGGKSGNQDAWVTELSVDLVRALDSQDRAVVFAFCGRSLQIESTPITLLKRLIIQVLEAYPLLAFHNPQQLNTRRLKKAEGFDQLWSLWQYLAGQLEEVFIVVDRIDQCKPIEEVSITKGLLPRFIKMMQDCPQISMIITCVSSPPPELKDHVMLQSIWVDTTRPPRTRD